MDGRTPDHLHSIDYEILNTFQTLTKDSQKRGDLKTFLGTCKSHPLCLQTHFIRTLITGVPMQS